MGKPPAYIFVVRHGARLDQADKKWHISSTTPFDSPLTYGGFLQAQAAGAKIASILRQAEAEAEQAAGSDTKTKKKRFKIAIHSSPFLRCVQSSVGISAGLVQPVPASDQSGSPPPSARSTSSESGAPSSPSTPPLPGDRRPSPTIPSPRTITKTPIRIDTFLGEWLNPEYFESITYPPNSSQMLSNAKVALLRKETISAYENSRPLSGSPSNSHGQLWSSGWVPPERTGSMDSGGFDNMSAMASALSRNRSGSGASGSSQRGRFGSIAEPTVNNNEGYVAPTPNYALSTSDKIPEGYVAHARDTCASIDYQWDTMEQWGNGGTYPEEWTTMHQRFRKGFQHLVDWYATTEKPAQLVTKTIHSSSVGDEESTNSDVEVENVVIVVSHGAGCNAMIGAITRQPVLMDVGVATVTMAVRKKDDSVKSAVTHISGRTVPIEEYYEMKMQANNEHLRSVSASRSGLTRTPSNPGSSGLNPQPHPRGRNSTISGYAPPASTSSGFALPDFGLPGSRSNSANANLASMRRASQPKPFGSASLNLSSGSSGSSFGQAGLWAPSTSQKKEEDEDIDYMFPDFDGTRRFGHSASAPPVTSQQASTTLPSSIYGSSGQSGTARMSSRLQEISRPASREGLPMAEEVNGSSDGNPKSGGLWGA